MKQKTVAIIGAGRVGSSMGFLLARAGYAVTAIAAQTAQSRERALAFIGAGTSTADVVKASGADIVFITTPDRAIREVCEEIAQAGGFKRGALVLHMSGAHSLDLLASAKSAGAHRAVVHPLQSVPSMDQGVRNLPGSYFRVEADPEALATAREIVRAIGGIELSMPGWVQDGHSAALYHAGAVVVSNYLVALLDFGLKFYEVLGADRNEALAAVLPLVKGTLANVETLGIPAALTGPIVRGDSETMQGHLEAMRSREPELLELYRALAKQTIAVAEQRGLAQNAAEHMRRLLEEK